MIEVTGKRERQLPHYYFYYFARLKKSFCAEHQYKSYTNTNSIPILIHNPSITMAPVEVAIIIYSMYGHIAELAEAEKRGIEAAGGKATIYQ